MIRTILLGACAWLLVAGFLVFQFWPHLPKSGPQWVLFVMFGPPVYVLLEGIFDWLFSEKHGRAISEKKFSGARIMVALSAIVAAFTLCGMFVWLAGRL